jgi:hypothetical protein
MGGDAIWRRGPWTTANADHKPQEERTGSARAR